MTTEYKILELRFSSVKSFREGNCIDFRKNINNNIIEVITKNSYGKTAIAWAILFCLYGKKAGKCFAAGDNHINGIFNVNDKVFDCSLLVSVNEDTYLIRRTGNIDYTKVRSVLYLIKDNETTIVSGKSNRKTNQCIEQIFGSCNNFLMCSSFMRFDGVCSSFIDLTSVQRYEYLFKAIRDNKFDACITKINEHVNEMISQWLNFKVLIENKNNKINIYPMRENKMSNINSVSGAEHVILDLAIKYAFMKVLPIIKPNIFIMDCGRVHSDDSTTKNILKYLNNNGINIMLLSNNEKFKNDNNFVLTIECKDGNSYINNGEPITYDRNPKTYDDESDEECVQMKCNNNVEYNVM